jgi:hydroxymethylbilane synthase
MTRPLRLGTRRSPLARAQARAVADSLARVLDRPVALVDVTTQGDVDPAPLAAIGGTGVFVSALRDALLAGEVDLAVHSLKDLPTAAPAGLTLAAVPARADARDVLVGPSSMAELAPGSRIGTGSPRRAAVLSSWGLKPVAVRGNVDTRLSMVTDGRLDGVVLALAGLTRLGRADRTMAVLDPEVMVPAPGQGALAVEVRADAPADVVSAVATLDDPATRAAATAERAVLAHLEVGCSAPLGAFASSDGSTLTMHARAWSADGAVVVDARASDAADQAEAIGRTVARTLLHRGAADLVPRPRTAKEIAL